MSWSFETEPEFQSQLDWIADFTRNEIEPLDLVFRKPGDPWDPASPAAKDDFSKDGAAATVCPSPPKGVAVDGPPDAEMIA